MNQDNDNPEAREVDPRVTAHYEKLADEKTPADLDQAVLREAARAVRADNRKGSFGAWFRPVAFMAMVGLSLVIILDLSDTSIFGPPPELSSDTAPPAPVPAPAVSAPGAVQQSLPQSAVSEMKRQKRAVAVQSPTMDKPEASAVAPLTKRQCLQEEKLDPELWWECIASLRQEELNEIADMELGNLRKAFPDFEPPE